MLLEGQLVNSSPEYVYDWLRTHAEGQRGLDPLDKEAQQALLARAANRPGLSAVWGFGGSSPTAISAGTGLIQSRWLQCTATSGSLQSHHRSSVFGKLVTDGTYSVQMCLCERRPKRRATAQRAVHARLT